MTWLHLLKKNEIVITGPVSYYIPINNKYSSKLSQKSINHNKSLKKND